ncbi:MAG: CpsD/CapB family tyrosine-protein kinase [Pirellulaceae bacterium]
MRTAIDRDQQYLDAFMSQLKSVDLGMESGGYQTTLITPPDEAKQVAPRTTLISAASIIIGLALGTLLGVWSDVSNDRFLHAADIVRTLELPVLSQIPVFPLGGHTTPKRLPESVCLDPSLCTFYRSNSNGADAFRALRTAINVRIRANRAKVIQIASANKRDGKTTIAANLAISFAQSGKRVLLVDADLQSPRLHTLFHLSPTDGLSTVLVEAAEVHDAVLSSSVENLSILPSGPCPTTPADTLETPRLKELFDRLRDDYDLVLVDSPGMLQVSDSRIIAAQSDGVLLVISHGTNNRHQVLRSVEMLKFSETPILGVVLNRTAEPRVQHLVERNGKHLRQPKQHPQHAMPLPRFRR